MEGFWVGLGVGFVAGCVGGWRLRVKYQRMLGRAFGRIQRQIMGGGKR